MCWEFYFKRFIKIN